MNIVGYQKHWEKIIYIDSPETLSLGWGLGLLALMSDVHHYILLYCSSSSGHSAETHISRVVAVKLWWQCSGLSSHINRAQFPQSSCPSWYCLIRECKDSIKAVSGLNHYFLISILWHDVEEYKVQDTSALIINHIFTYGNSNPLERMERESPLWQNDFLMLALQQNLPICHTSGYFYHCNLPWCSQLVEPWLAI